MPRADACRVIHRNAFFLQVALITSMLPACSREGSLAPEQLQESAAEQTQDSITVATVDSYQASSHISQ